MLKGSFFNSLKNKQLVVLLALLLPIYFSAQSFSERTFAIAEFLEEESLKNVLQNKFSKNNFGISISIYEDINTGTLELKLNEGDLSLKNFFKLLNTQIDTQRNTIFPLFIEFDGDEDKLINALKSTGVLNKMFYQPNNERWPDIKTLISQNKPLIIFKKNALKTPLNATNNHVLEYKENNSNIPTHGLNNELLLIKSFTKENLPQHELPIDWNRISVNPYCINYLMHCWNNSGKRPNFIFYSSVQNQGTFYHLAKLLSDTEAVRGKITNESSILKGINWSHKLNSYTNGYYSFPFENGEKLILKPMKEGYKFTPPSFNVSENTDSKSIFDFKANKLTINDNLSALYRFDGDLVNAIQPDKPRKNSPNFVHDKEKNTVLKFENKNYIKLKNVRDYNLINSSFTISIDFKYDKSGLEENYCLIGSDEEGFRKGLHVNILKGKPAFGFFTNDIKSDYYAKPNMWHHLILKYNIDTQKQSIYIDGNKIEEASNKPSFIGSSNLLLGQGIKQDNFFNGYLDNLKIWNRALSHEEIVWLENNSIKIIKPAKGSNNYYIPFLIVISSLIAALIFIILRYKKTKNTQPQSDIIKNGTPEINKQKTCVLYLFGKFEIIDSGGTDYSHEFSPKIKELFLLVLLRTIKTKRGISTTELTNILWPGFETTKAANNRGVSFNALKKNLRKIDGIDVVYEDKFWKIVLDNDFYIDYQWVIDFTKSKKTNYQPFFNVVKRGEFLFGIKKNWLLEEKSNLNFDILDLLLVFCKEQYKSGNYHQTLEIASYVQKIDELNLQGLFYQLHSLSKKGSKNKVSFIFENFCQKYEDVNAIKFNYNLKAFLKENPEKIWD